MESNDKIGDAAFLIKTNIVSGNNKGGLLPIILPTTLPIWLKSQSTTLNSPRVTKEYENIDHN
jgi:hypothetical protein